MPKTRMGYERIKALHDANDHSRCRFGCSPENPTPAEETEFRQSYQEASRELAKRLGPSDPRVRVAEDTRAYLDTHPDLPTLILAELEGNAMMTDDMSGDEPDMLEKIRVRAARRLLEDCLLGVYHADIV